MGFFPKEGVDETFSREHQLRKWKWLSFHKKEKKNDRRNKKITEYSILAIKFKSSRTRPYPSAYGNTKSLAIISFVNIIPEKYTF